VELLDWSFEQLQFESRDLAIARAPDLQGLGASLRA
jgi:hypothetical protein